MEFLKRFKRKMATFYHKSRGATIAVGAAVDVNVDIHNPKNVKVNSGSTLHKNLSLYVGANGRFEIGKNSHIAPFGYLLIDKNSVTIGDNVAIGPFCTFICHSNHFEGESHLFAKNYLDGDIKIGNNVFIGAQCTILPGTVISDNVVVASNSVVKGELTSNRVYGGSPVKLLKSINDGE